ncbi:MAG: hypothetical protein K2Y22_12825 [Candidatus Obscuribacterales bacterium]|nr:hypothetical protein [Candidatus Obscuribacterales bacterium]
MIRYLASLPPAKQILWGYFLWYLVFACLYFDADVRLWLTSLGIALIVGLALYTNAKSAGNTKLETWQTFRFFLTPFCVSSFSALVKGRDFILVFSPKLQDNLIAAGVIATAFCLTLFAKALKSR